MSRPTKKFIMDRMTDLRTFYSMRNTNFGLDDTYYELLFRDKLGLPEEYKDEGVVLPTARDVVDAGTNHVSTVYARFLRPIRGTDQEAKEQAEMLRKFDTGMFYRTKIDAETSPWRAASKHGCLYGMWCFETLYDPDKIPEEPEHKDGETDSEFKDRMDIYNGELLDIIPINIRTVHPQNVYPDPDGQFMIIEESKTLMQARQEWKNWRAPAIGSSPNYSEVSQLTYFDREYRAIYVADQPVLPTADDEGVVEHDYGFIPYVVGYSGLGNLSKSAKPELKAVGLIRYLRNLLRSESFAYSVYNIIMKAHSWPITFVSGPGAADMATIKLKFGKIYEKPSGVTIEDYVKAAPPELVQQHMEYTSSILAASAAPRSVRGLPEAGVRSGTDRSLVISEARLKYDTILEQMQLSTAKVMSNCTKIAERVVPADFRIWAKAPGEEFDIRIDRSKIKHHYTTFVEFTPVSPEEEARRHADMENLVKTGIISASTGRRRYMSHIDPIAEDIKVEAEKLRNDPAIRQVLAQIVAQELVGEATRLTKIRQLQAGIMPQQAGALQPQVAAQPALSMPGGAQALSAMVRQRMGAYKPNMPGSPEEMAAQIRGMGQTPGLPVRTPGAMPAQGV